MTTIAEDVEEWRSIYGPFDVSSLGRVRRRKATENPHVYKLGRNPGGYRHVILCLNNIRVQRAVHRLVAEVFIGPPPTGAYACHLDGNPNNNRVENLKWGTPKENASHLKIHGTALVGEKNHKCNISDQMVRDIRAMYARGVHVAEIARKINRSRSPIDRIIKGVSRGYVK